MKLLLAAAGPRPAPALSLALLLALTACSSASDAPDPGAFASSAVPDGTSSASFAPVEAAQDAVPPAEDTGAPAPAPARVIGLEGLGDLRIGQPVPKGTSWAERGAQTSDACRTVSSPDYPGVYAIVLEGKVRRITVGQRSDVTVAEGVGVGATEKEVAKWFAGFREERHKYEEAPAKYLTAPNADRGEPALRFEIGRDGRVSLIHVGTMPVLGYVEACA